MDRHSAFAALERWLDENPDSRWFPALKHELMSYKFERGYFDKAQDGWLEIWEQVRDSSDPNTGALENEVLSRLLDSMIGRNDIPTLKELIAQTEMVKPALDTGKAPANLAQALRPSKLTEEHGEKLSPGVKALGGAFRTLTGNQALQIGLRKTCRAIG